MCEYLYEKRREYDKILTCYLRDLSRRVGRNERRKDMFYLTTHSTHFIYGYMASSDMVKEGMKEIFYLMMHSTHFIYGYMASDMW